MNGRERLTEEIERLKRRRQLAYGKGETTAGTILTLQIGAMERARAVAFDGAGLTNDAW